MQIRIYAGGNLQCHEHLIHKIFLSEHNVYPSVGITYVAANDNSSLMVGLRQSEYIRLPRKLINTVEPLTRAVTVSFCNLEDSGIFNTRQRAAL